MKYKSYIENRRGDDDFMHIALKAAEAALSRGDMPVGAVLRFSNETHIVESNTAISEGHCISHAEMNLVKKAATMSRKLDGCVVYTTLEPCAMCAYAMEQAGISELIFGAYDKEYGFHTAKEINPCDLRMGFKGGVLALECMMLIPQRLRENIYWEEPEDEHKEERARIMEGLVNRIGNAENKEERAFLHMVCRHLGIGIF